MNTKSKLRIAVGFLIFLILLLTLLAVSQVKSIADATDNILKDNYQSLEYTNIMVNMSDKILTDTSLNSAFETYIQKQQNNITEIGEAEHSLRLAKSYEYLLIKNNKEYWIAQMKDALFEIASLNMNAIQEKSMIAQQTSQKAKIWIFFIGLLCTFFALFILWALPNYITVPVKKLTESILQIAENNYTQRVNFEQGSEFQSLALAFNAMAEKLDEYNNSNMAKFFSEKKRLEALVDNMQDPILGIDENKNIILANQAACAVTGREKDELLQFSLTKLADENDLLSNLCNLLENKEEQENNEVIKIYSDGRESFFEKKIITVLAQISELQSKKAIGHFIFLRNVTAYKEMDTAKTNFMAVISHEFKTPIASIKMGLNLLLNKQTGKLNSEQKTYISGISDDVERLLSITSELVKIAQIESGNILFAPNDVFLPDIIADAVESCKVQAQARNIEIAFSKNSCRYMVNVDRDKLIWVLVNVIQNAVRYSYNDSKIELGCKKAGNQCLIFVKDTGPGIAKEFQEKIFEKYFRVPGNIYEGTGLGLSICKQLLLRQGGDIYVESDLGKGCIFWIAVESGIKKQTEFDEN
jgi:PAS domain S-box-containing protein